MKKEKTEAKSSQQPQEGANSSDWLNFLKTIPKGNFVRLSQKDHDLKKVRKTIKRLRKKNLTEVEYAIGGTRANRSVYILRPRES